MTKTSTEPPTTLAQWLDPAKVDFALLEQRHGPLLELPRRMLGVAPNSHPYLEIWPTALRSYNLLVPNFLNMPLVMWGVGAPPGLVGLSMYTASRTAECMYCSAHSCSFALRRGLASASVADALDPDAEHTAAERAVIAVARGVSSRPPSLGDGELDELRRHVSDSHAEWIVLAAVMMGFLNKCMSTLGVALEAAVADEVRDVISESGWTPGHHGVVRDDRPAFAFGTDSLRRKLALLPLLPGAVLRERAWTKGVPSAWPAAGRYLEQRVGYDFPLLGGIGPARIIRALTTMLRDNLDPELSELGIELKCLAGLVFSAALGNETLLQMSRALAVDKTPVHGEGLDALVRWGEAPTDFDDGDALAAACTELESIEGIQSTAAIALAWSKAIAHDPSRITPALLERASALTPASMIELVTWGSILQLLHRLSVASSSRSSSA